MKLISACCCIALMWASGCAQARSVNPKRLKDVAPPVAYVLREDVAVEGYNITFTMRAGRYLMRYRDAKGGYLLGEGQCMHWDIHSPKVTGSNDFPCGIYLPTDPTRGASFYVVRAKTGTNPEMGPVINAIIRYNYGSFDWPDKAESQALRAALVPVDP